MDRLSDRKTRTKLHAGQYRPTFYRLSDPSDATAFGKLLEQESSIQVFDTIDTQLRDLLKTRYPGQPLDAQDIREKTAELLGELPIEEYGVWVYYPWSGRLVHTLDEEEFIELRTNRNLYKINAEEQEQLRQRKIAIAGLSVGQSIALTLVMERICGSIILADFDTLDLSNLNRIRTGIYNLELPKVVIAAREIAEIDPYIHVEILPEGITHNNLEHLLARQHVDILLDECDSMEMKIAMRQVARRYKVPVVMDTSDRGQLDVERFDLEPDRPILHGRLDSLDMDNADWSDPQFRMKVMLSILDFEKASARAQYSFMQIGKTISTWPQLASSVTLGGALAADACRRILLGQFTASGRFFVELEQLVA